MKLLREVYIFVKRPFWMLSQIIMWAKSERRIRKEEVQRSPSMWFVYEMRSNTLKNARWGLDAQREYVKNFDLDRSLKAARKERLKYLKDVILRTSPEYWA